MSKKTFTVKKTNFRTRESSYFQGTLEELCQEFKYTLMLGQSYQHEHGNKKVDTQPRTITALIKNLNIAVSNSAVNGCNYLYELVSHDQM